MSALLDSYFGDMSFVERKSPVSHINADDWLDYSVSETVGDLLDGEPRDIANLIDENIDMDLFWATQKAALVALYYSQKAFKQSDRDLFKTNYEVFARSHFQALIETLEKVAANAHD
jgi:hypothetical protein